MASKILQLGLEEVPQVLAATGIASQITPHNAFERIQHLFYDPATNEQILYGNQSSESSEEVFNALMNESEEEEKYAPVMEETKDNVTTHQLLEQSQFPVHNQESVRQIPGRFIRPMLQEEVDGTEYHVLGNEHLASVYRSHHQENPRIRVITLEQYNRFFNRPLAETPGVSDEQVDAIRDAAVVPEHVREIQRRQGDRGVQYSLNMATARDIIRFARLAYITSQAINKKRQESKVSNAVLEYDKIKYDTELEYPGRRYYIYITKGSDGKVHYHRILQPQTT